MPKTGATFAMYRYDAKIELWTLGDPSTLRVVDTGLGPLSAMAYASDGSGFFTAGRDGRIVAWSTDAAAHHDLAHIPASIELIVAVPNRTNELLAKTADGALWRVHDAEVATLLPPGDEVFRARFSHDGRWLATGTVGGAFSVIDTQHWQPVVRRTLPAAIRDLNFSAHDEQVAVALPSAVITIDVPGSTGARALPWNQVDIAGRTEFSANGAWFAVTSADGALWFYSIAERRWACEVVRGGKLLGGSFSPDSKFFAATDAEGRVWLVDTAALRFR